MIVFINIKKMKKTAHVFGQIIIALAMFQPFCNGQIMEPNPIDFVTETVGDVDFGKTKMSAYTPEIRENMKQLYEYKFGWFVHFGPYAQLAGEWKGKQGAAEWIMRRSFIPVEEYEKEAAGKFKPENQEKFDF